VAKEATRQGSFIHFDTSTMDILVNVQALFVSILQLEPYSIHVDLVCNLIGRSLRSQRHEN
jgi:hypothetical protein